MSTEAWIVVAVSAYLLGMRTGHWLGVRQVMAGANRYIAFKAERAAHPPVTLSSEFGRAAYRLHNPTPEVVLPEGWGSTFAGPQQKPDSFNGEPRCVSCC